MSNFTQRLVKKFNNEDVIAFADKDGFRDIKSWTHTGSPELDYNLNTFGFPTGIIELAGKSKSGKTTLGLMGMKHFMKENPNGVVVILSSENRDNKDYAEKLGIKTEDVLIIKVRYVEAMFMQVKTLIEEVKKICKEEKTQLPNFYFLWDSLGATLSKSELDTMEVNVTEMEKKAAKGEELSELKHEKIGAFAKPAKMFAKFLLGEMYDKNIHFIMLNHQYDKMGGNGGRQSTGGEWVELFPTMRLVTSVIETIQLEEKDGDVTNKVDVGQVTQVKVVKNDFGPRVTTNVEIILGYGICLSQRDIEYGITKGIIKKEGVRKHTFLGKMTWSTKREFYDLYRNGDKLLPILEKKLAEARKKDVSEKRGLND